MKKKGFTLVELLAVIVILAIIALIATPLILGVIEKTKIGALESSVHGLVESANMYYANNTIKGETLSETIFDFEDGVQISDKKLEYKGKVYNGKLILHANGEVAVCIDDEEHYAYKNKDTDEIVSGIGTCLYDGTTGDFSSNSPLEVLQKQIASVTATSDNVLEGNTIYTSDGLVFGTMLNYSGQTVNTTEIVENGDNVEITIPSSGYYDETSKISISGSKLGNNSVGISSYLEINNTTAESPINFFSGIGVSANGTRVHFSNACKIKIDVHASMFWGGNYAFYYYLNGIRNTIMSSTYFENTTTDKSVTVTIPANSDFYLSFYAEDKLCVNTIITEVE